MLDFISIFGFITSILILIFFKSSYYNKIFLCGFYFSIGVFGLGLNSLIYFNNKRILVELLPILFPIVFLTAPCLYLYVRKTYFPSEVFRWFEYLHFFPVLITALNFSPTLFISQESKSEFLNQAILNPLHLLDIQYLFFSFKFCIVIRPFLGLIYMFFTLKLLLGQSSFGTNQSKSFTYRENWNLTLIILTTVLYLAVMAVGIYLNVTNFDIQLLSRYKIISAVPTFITFLTNVSILFFPKILYNTLAIKQVDEEVHHINQVASFFNENFNGGEEVELVYTRISEQLEIYFQDKSYLKTGFTLSTITKETKIPYYRLSNYFTIYLGVNFNDWKNNLRILHAIDLIDHGQAVNLTLESIAYSCGYLSR